ncbi:hypothetical protein AGMMS49940_21850 [Spirochaetia bacterium]|nr:hypothetical protein AGMMS49940_21850 [Spirochaetia bacterium]
MRKIKMVFAVLKNMARFFYRLDQSRQEMFFTGVIRNSWWEEYIGNEQTIMQVRNVFYRQFVIDHNARLAREKELEDIRKHNAEADAARRAKLEARKNKTPVAVPEAAGAAE